MAERTVYIVGVGPIYWEDTTDTYPGTSTLIAEAIVADAPIKVSAAPTDGSHVVRLDDLGTVISGVVGKLYAPAASVDGIVAATTNILTAVADLVIMGIIVRLASVSGFVSPPRISVGLNSDSEAIMTDTELTGVQLADDCWIYMPSFNKSKVVRIGDVVKCIVSIAANATSYNLSIDMIGYLL